MVKINCKTCVHYYVTWQAKSPQGCRGYGFKSLQIPSIVVKKNSGVDCSIYQPKVRKGE